MDSQYLTLARLPWLLVTKNSTLTRLANSKAQTAMNSDDFHATMKRYSRE